ncbi:MAG: 50S ribosomal protein L7/L12 [Clostridia bacterium]
MATEKSLKILEEIKTLTILELADLVKAVEEEFGVSAAPVAVAGPAAGAAAPVEEEKTEFDVELTGFEADKKLKVIKEIKDITGLSLGEAKALVEGSPKMVKTGVSKDESEEIKKKLTDVGGTVTIK